MYQLKHSVFDQRVTEALVDGVLNSPYLGNSPLGPEFVKTKGFSIVFQRDAMEALISAFPYLCQFLDCCVFPKSNAFYLNTLIMTDGSRVDAHIDCRLVVSQNMRIIPTIVSIFYASADPAGGGHLTLGTGTPQATTIAPKPGDLLHFRGDIVHDVSPYMSQSPRINVVCEQYNLTSELLDDFPIFEVITQATDAAPRVNALATP